MRPKLEYYTIILDSQEEMSWVYSASDFQKVLNDAFRGQILTKVFVDLAGYLDLVRREEDFFDFSYMGGKLILVFEKQLLELVIHVEGMMEYRIIPIYDARIPKCGKVDYPPSDMRMTWNNDYYNLGKEFELNCFEQKVEKITVNKTDIYPFYLEGFDEALATDAAERGNLPAGVEISMSNGVLLKLLGDSIEYLFVELEKQKE